VGLVDRFLCLIGLHANVVADWNSFAGNYRCLYCDKVTPMTGNVLVEWIKYRTRKGLRP